MSENIELPNGSNNKPRYLENSESPIDWYIHPTHFDVLVDRSENCIIDIFMFHHYFNNPTKRPLIPVGYTFNLISYYGKAQEVDCEPYLKDYWLDDQIVTEVIPIKIQLIGRAVMVWKNGTLLNQEETIELTDNLGFMDNLAMAQACIRTESDEFLGYLIYFRKIE